MTAVLSHATRFVAIALAVTATALLGACANPFSRQSLDSFSLTYKIDIQQGIVVTQEMADQLKVGMTRDQVRFVLGTPILTDAFHAQRWDYPFRFQPGRGPVEERRFTVYFANDRMTGYNGDSLPTEEEFARSRNFATTRIVRGPVPTGPVSQPPSSPGAASDISGTSVTPGRNAATRPAAVDATPTAPTSPN